MHKTVVKAHKIVWKYIIKNPEKFVGYKNIKIKLGRIKETEQITAFLKAELLFRTTFKINAKIKIKKYIKLSALKNKTIEDIAPKKQNTLYFFCKAIAKDKQNGDNIPEILAKLKTNPKTKNNIFFKIKYSSSVLPYFNTLPLKNNHLFFVEIFIKYIFIFLKTLSLAEKINFLTKNNKSKLF